MFFYDRHSFQNVHKPISGQLVPAAAANRFSDDTVLGEKIGRWSEREERYIENNKEARRKGTKKAGVGELGMKENGIFAVQLKEALNVFESQT